MDNQDEKNFDVPSIFLNLIGYPIYLTLSLSLRYYFRKYKLDRAASITLLVYELKLFIQFVNSILMAIDDFSLHHSSAYDACPFSLATLII